MRIATRFVSRAAASSMVVAATLALVGFQATAQTASAATKVVTCTTANTKVTVTKPSRPINHLLLKATNTGTKPCYAYSAPFLRAGANAQAPVEWAEETTPQSVLMLKPGKSAYAGITTSSPDGEGGSRIKTLGVIFANKKGNATSTEKTLKLPKGGVFFNSAANVTYWQGNAADALAW